MKLKRIVAAVLAIIMLLALVACGEGGQSGSDSSNEAISESDALAKARNYIESDPLGKQRFVNGAMPSGAESMYNIDASSASCTGKTDDGGYEIVVKGNFFADDEYGNLYGHYTFECPITVSSTGSITFYSTDITVRKA